MVRSAIAIVRAGAERIDDLEPLWGALQDYHAELVPTLEGAPARSVGEAWTLRRRKYLTALADPDAFVMIAEQAERAVGYALVSLGEGPSGWDLGERVADVETLSVLPEVRGRGVGTRLMDAVEEELVRLNIGSFRVLVIAANECLSTKEGASRRSAGSSSGEWQIGNGDRTQALDRRGGVHCWAPVPGAGDAVSHEPAAESV